MSIWAEEFVTIHVNYVNMGALEITLQLYNLVI